MAGLAMTSEGLGDGEQMRQLGQLIKKENPGNSSVEHRILKGKKAFRSHLQQELTRLGDPGIRAYQSITRFFAKLWNQESPSERIPQESEPEDNNNELFEGKEVHMSFGTFRDALWCITAISVLPREGQSEQEQQWVTEKIFKIMMATDAALGPEELGFHKVGDDKKTIILVNDPQEGLQLKIPLSQQQSSFQQFSVKDLIQIPDPVKPDLERLIGTFGFFLGRNYSVTDLIEDYVFESREHREMRRQKIEHILSPLLSALSDALDYSWEENACLQVADEEEGEEVPQAIRGATKGSQLVKAQPKALHWASLDELRLHLRENEKNLRKMWPQFEERVERLLMWLEVFLRNPDNPPQAPQHQISDYLEEPSSRQEKRLNEIYRILIPGSTFDILNPVTLILSLVQEHIRRSLAAVQNGEAEYQALREIPQMTIHELLSSFSPTTRFYNYLKQKGAAESKLGRIAQGARFSEVKNPSRLAVREGLIRESLRLPVNEINLEDQLRNSPILQGKPSGTEDTLIRIFLQIHEALTRGSGATSFNARGLFWRISGSLLEIDQWVKPESAVAHAPRLERARWFVIAYEAFTAEEDEEVAQLMDAFFKGCVCMTKKGWDAKGPGGQSFLQELIEFAKMLPYSEETAQLVRKELQKAKMKQREGVEYIPGKMYSLLKARQRRCFKRNRSENPPPAKSESGRAQSLRDYNAFETQDPIEFLQKELEDIQERLNHIERFKNCYDQKYQQLQMTVEEFVVADNRKLNSIGESISAVWHEILMSSLPLLFDFMRQDQRMRGRLAKTMRMQDVQDRKLLKLMEYLQERVGLTFPEVYPNGKIDTLTIRGVRGRKKKKGDSFGEKHLHY